MKYRLHNQYYDQLWISPEKGIITLVPFNKDEDTTIRIAGIPIPGVAKVYTANSELSNTSQVVPFKKIMEDPDVYKAILERHREYKDILKVPENKCGIVAVMGDHWQDWFNLVHKQLCHKMFKFPDNVCGILSIQVYLGWLRLHHVDGFAITITDTKVDLLTLSPSGGFSSKLWIFDL